MIVSHQTEASASPATGGGHRGPNLAADNPTLAQQWHPAKNGSVTPTDVAACSQKRVWWLCADCGNEWEATVANRNHLRNPRGCLLCAKAGAWGFRDPKPGSSLADRFPDIAAWWHPTRNGELTPRDVLPGASSRNVWWQCPRGHEWSTSPGLRTSQNTGCPQCNPHGTSRFEIELFHELCAAGLPATQGFKVTGAGRPMLVDITVKDWNLIIEFDGNLFHGTARSRERDRVKTAALMKLGWDVVRIRQDLEPITARDLRVGIATRVLDVTHALLRHLKELGYVFDAQTYLAAEERLGIEEAAKAFAVAVGRTFATVRPDMIVDWDSEANVVGADSFAASAQDRVWWRCHRCGYRWRAAVLSRVKNEGPGCGSCRRKGRAQVPRPGQSLLDLHPLLGAEVAVDLNEGRTAADYTAHSGQVIWWRCHRGHTWLASVDKRTTRAQGCRECRRTDGYYLPRPESVDQSLAADPEIAAWWHPSKNGNLTPSDVGKGSFYRAWWLCPQCGREWQTTVANRTRRRGGCRPCVFANLRGYRMPGPGESAAESYPHLLKQWHPTENGDLTLWDLLPTSHYRAYWLCERGHESRALLTSRTRNGSGCGECALDDRWESRREAAREPLGRRLPSG